jgi:copper oxidase (laccase) domain-containing protein
MSSKFPAASHPGILVFPPFQELDWLTGGLILRQDDLSLDLPKPELRHALDQRQAEILKTIGIPWSTVRCVHQVHGNRIVTVNSADAADTRGESADGLATAIAGVTLGIRVADCGSIFLADKRRRAIALLHSGRRGTEANVAREGLRELLRLSGGQPADVRAVLGPCIHGCCYDVDFVSQIEQQLAAEGVRDIWRHPDCTGCHLDRYYSYRKEKGRTGRMLAFLRMVP